MSKEKRSRVDLLEKKVKAIIQVLSQMNEEIGLIKDLSIGTLETVKKMDGYEEAIKSLKEDLEEAKESDKKFETNEDNN